MTHESEVRREARQMRKEEVIIMAIEGRIRWLDAADILGMTPRHMRRLRQRFEHYGYDGVRDYRGGVCRRKRIAVETIAELCRLRREKYADFSVQHFWEFATEKHGIKIGYTWAKRVLQAAGLAEKSSGRGQYRRRRERRPLRGMLLHLDASTHEWIVGQPKWDLMVMLDDADGRILYARFVEQEGTVSTLEALQYVLIRYGRFCELYTDRGSHFCTTSHAEAGPDTTQNGQVARALKTLGIRHILARSPQARGRSERAFGTIQGRLPQELKLAGISTYDQANTYLENTFVPDFNSRFTVEPAQAENAFTSLAGFNVSLILSVQQERVVNNDSTVHFNTLVLQLPQTDERPHYVRCPVVVHQFLDSTLGVSYQGRLLAKYTPDGKFFVNSAMGPADRKKSDRKQTRRAMDTDELMDKRRRLPTALGQPADGLPTVSTASTTEFAYAFSEIGKNKTRSTALQPSGHL